MSGPDVLVLGGGVSGLATAWWLARAGVSVEVWERTERPGGKIRSERSGGFVMEDAATMLMNFRPEVDRLVGASGLALARQSRIPGAGRYVVQRGRLVEVPTGIGAILASRLWSWRGKLRLLAEPFLPRGGHRGESVSEFIARRLGAETLERAVEPFVAGPLASDPDRAEARAVLPRMTALERRFGSLSAGVLYGKLRRRGRGCGLEAFSFRGGMATLTEALATAPGVRVCTGRVAVALEPVAGGWRATGSDQRGSRSLRVRELVLAVPAGVAGALLAPIDPDLGGLLDGIEYAPLTVVHLGFDRAALAHRLAGAGFLVPRAERLRLGGCLWTSSLFAGRAPPGRHLLTCYLGGARRPEVAAWSDDQAVAAVLGDLDRLLGVRAAPERVRVVRHRAALPLYHGAYSARMAALEACLRRRPGLHVVANYRGGVSVRDRIACAYATATRIAETLGRPLAEALGPRPASAGPLPAVARLAGG